MVCKKCGNKLKPNVKYCLECGELNDETLDDEEYNEEYEDMPPLDEVYEEVDFSDDEDDEQEIENSDGEIYDNDISLSSPLVEAYIGKDYKSISTNIMNIFAIFLSWIYFIYKKMYIIGILGFLLTGFVYKYCYDFLIIYIIIVMVGSGMLFNTIYLHVVKRRVNRLKKRRSSLKEQKELCKRKGGTNLFLPLFSFALLLVYIVLNSFEVVDITKDKFYEQNTNNQANCKSIAKQAYTVLETNEIKGNIVGVACNITIEDDTKVYNLYFKMREKLIEKYLYVEYKDTVLNLKGNTEVIDMLNEKEDDETISDNEKNILKISKTLKTKYKTISDDSEYEKRIADIGTNTKERENYMLTKNDIIE